MERRDALKFLMFGSAFAAACKKNELPPDNKIAPRPSTKRPRFRPPAQKNVTPVPLEEEQAFYARHAGLLTVNAQEKPYNEPDNCFFITKSDFKRIESEIQTAAASVGRKINDQGVIELIKTRQKGFVKFMFLKAGYGGKGPALDTLIPPELAQPLSIYGAPGPNVKMRMVNQKLLEQNVSASLKFIQVTDRESYVDSLANQMLARIEGNSGFAMFPGHDNLIQDVLGITPEDDGRGAVYIGSDKTRADGHYICEATLLDPALISPDMFRMSHTGNMINLHERGHRRVKNARDDHAEKHGALSHRVEFPEDDGALLMFLDLRSMMMITGSSEYVSIYAQTGRAQKQALATPRESIPRNKDALLAMVKQGLPRDRRSTPMISISKDRDGTFVMTMNREHFMQPYRMLQDHINIFRMRVQIWENYMQIEKAEAKKEKGTKPRDAARDEFLNLLGMLVDDVPGIVGMRLRDYNQATINELRHFSRGGTLETLDKKPLEEATAKLVSVMALQGKRVNPAILAQALRRTAGNYGPDQWETEIIQDALTAIRNFNDPVRAYNLQPNIEFQPYMKPETKAEAKPEDQVLAPR